MNTTFEWDKSKQLSHIQILIAVFLPSAIGFIGFHGVVPWLVDDQQVPPLLAWSYTAMGMLALLVGGAIVLLYREAKELKISLKARLMLENVTVKKWVLYIVIALVMMGVIGGVLQPLMPLFWDMIGFTPPEYYPFFLRGLDPMNTPMEVLSPGFPLQGEYGLLPLIAVVLALNIFAEDLYFRAWLLPKMSWLGRMSWVYNGVLFALYHTFQLWMLPILLVATLTFAYVVWDSRSVLPSLVLHFILNFSMSILGILMLIAS